MADAMLLLGVILTLAGASAQNSGTYLVMVPSVMRPGRPIDLSVTILQASATSSVTASLKQGKTDIASSTSASVSAGSPQKLSIQVPSDIDTNLDYVVSVEGTGDVTFLNTTSIKPQRKTVSIFIQTDKGIYKPGQTVQFRTLAVYPDLKPYLGSFDIDLFDKNGNKIKQWKDLSNATGVISGELQLSDQPPLGDWRIAVEANGWKEEKTFEVDEYVLPRFEVSVDLPSYYSLKMMDKLMGSVSAKYTYGEPVKGKAKISIQLAPHYWDNTEYKSIDKYVETSDGTVDFELAEKEMISLVPKPTWMDDDRQFSPTGENLKGRKILVTANFTERETGITLTGENSVEVPYWDFQLEFMESTPDSFKPGLSYTAFLKLSQADGMPLTSSQLLGDSGKPETVTLTASYGYKSGMKDKVYQITVPASGIMKQVIDIPSNCTTLNLNAAFKDVYGSHHAKEFKSSEKTGIQISLLNQNGALKADMTANFQVKSTVSISGFQYEILSKGIIVRSGYQPSNGQNPITLDIPLDSDLVAKLAPSARIVAWYMTESGEIITDSMNFNADGAFANDVSVAFSTNNTKPGENIDVSMTAYPQSYIGLLAVDQSVLLLASGNDIEESEVLAELESYDSTKDTNDNYPMPIMFDGKRKKRCIGCDFWWPIFSGGTDSSEIFENAGVQVMTDALVYKSPHRGNYYYGFEEEMAVDMDDGAMDMRPMAGAAAGAGNGDKEILFKGEEGGELKEVDTVRTVFPETWLWTDVFAEDDGTAKVSTKVPDTITSWIASAFALSTDKGLGLAPTRPKMTVFKPFFISLNLPYSVIRGEEFPLQVVVFNYMEGDQDVTVTLSGSKEFKVRKGNEIDAETTDGDVQEEVAVAAGDSGSVVFWIVPNKLGRISFEVKGQTTTAADGVKRTLLVEPEGAPKEEADSVMIKLDNEITSFTKDFQINFPAVGLVPGSESITVSVVGDIMGSSMNNLDSLLKMPYGCGEQNMLNFAPNIFVMQYLAATDQVNGEIQEKATKFMTSGYQRELTYQRKDGSFSAFGESDPAGSMWLTAFVIKSFNSAKQFIFIDQTTIDNAAKWIVAKQGTDGSFKEPENGRVIHSEMQGGSSQGLPLTAYTLVALLENKDGLGERVSVDNAIQKALSRLESKLDSITDPYSLALVTYALQLAQSSKARAAFDKLNDLAYVEDGYKYWSKTGEEEKPAEPEPYWGHRQPKSVDVEMTSYALLTYAERNNINEGIPIMKWLISKRSASGGFASTQDTVLGLQSLSHFAAQASGGDTAMNVELNAGTTTHSFDMITKDNNVLLQTFEIPASSSQVTVSASGKGVAIVQVGLKYNVYETSNKPSVVVHLSTKEEKNQVTLNACGSWKNKEEESGMVVMEVYQLTGYAVDTTNLNDYKDKGLKRFETDAQKLTMYFDEFTKDNLCVTVNSRKVTEIRNLKDARVAAYSYYDPQTVDTQFYTAETAGEVPSASPKYMGPGLILTFFICGLISYLFLM